MFAMESRFDRRVRGSLRYRSESRSRPAGTFALVAALVGLLTAAAAPLVGQEWAGPAAFEVRVDDERGRPVEGAEVVLAYAGLVERPAPVRTDRKGRAAVGGLAAGAWSIEVRHAGHMTYRGTILLGADAKPVVESAAQHNVPGAVAPMRIRFSRARGAVPAAKPLVQAAAPPAPTAPATPAAAPVAAAPAPQAAEASPKGSPEVAAPASPVVAAPAPQAAEASPKGSSEIAAPAAPVAAARAPQAAEASPKGSSEVAAPAAPVAAAPAPQAAEASPKGSSEIAAPAAPVAASPASAPAPARSAEASVALSPKQPAVATPAPTPSPARSAEAPAEPSPKQPAVATPAPTPSPVRSAEAPAAPTPKQPAVATPAPSPSPARSAEAPAAPSPKQQAVAAPAPSPSPARGAEAPGVPAAPVPLAPVARTCYECGPGEQALWTEVQLAGPGGCGDELRAELAGAAIATLPSRLRALPAGCAVLRVDVPRGMRYLGFRYEAALPGGRSSDCFPDRPCAAGGCRFAGEPILLREGSETTVLAFFEVDGAEPRSGGLTVYYASSRRKP